MAMPRELFKVDEFKFMAVLLFVFFIIISFLFIMMDNIQRRDKLQRIAEMPPTTTTTIIPKTLYIPPSQSFY
jgi:hypothetical protein